MESGLNVVTPFDMKRMLPIVVNDCNVNCKKNNFDKWTVVSSNFILP